MTEFLLLTKLILETLGPEVKSVDAKDMLSQAFYSTCGNISFYSNFHEATAKLHQPFTFGLCCTKEAWKGADACPSVLPNNTLVTKLGSRLRRKHTQVCTSQTTLPGFLWTPLTLKKFLQIFLLPKLGRRASQLTIHYEIKLYFMSLWRHPVLGSPGSKGQALLKEVKNPWQHLESSRL